MRYFIAAFPDEQVRAALTEQVTAALARAPQARPMQPRNLHVTVAFIGSMSSDEVTLVAHACRAEQFQPIGWRLDRIGRFAHAGVVWAGDDQCPEMRALMVRMAGTLDRLGVPFDRRPPVPHVTLLRNARGFKGGSTIDPPIMWTVRSVALYASSRDDKGPIYRHVDPAP